jgi:hypothetical protein
MRQPRGWLLTTRSTTTSAVETSAAMTVPRLAAVAHRGAIARAARKVATPAAVATPVQIPTAASSRRPGTGARVVVAMSIVVMVAPLGLGQVDVLEVRCLTKEYESSWIFERCLTCANALRRVQHPGFSLVSALFKGAAFPLAPDA